MWKSYAWPMVPAIRCVGTDIGEPVGMEPDTRFDRWDKLIGYCYFTRLFREFDSMFNGSP